MLSIDGTPNPFAKDKFIPEISESEKHSETEMPAGMENPADRQDE